MLRNTEVTFLSQTLDKMLTWLQPSSVRGPGPAGLGVIVISRLNLKLVTISPQETH